MKTKRLRKFKTEKIKNVQLKDDFYSFINKKWINHTKIPKDEQIISNFSILGKKIDSQLKDIIKLDTKLSSIYKNSQWNDAEVKNSIFSFLKMNFKDIYEIIAFLIFNGFGNIITLQIEQCIYNPKKRVISLDAAPQTFPTCYYKEKKYKKYIDFYNHYLKKWFAVFGKNNTSHIIEIETFLMNNVKPNSFLRKVENSYFLMTNDECIKTCDFDWGKLLGYLNIELPQKIVIRQPEYLKNIMIYFEKWNTDFFTPFWTYKILMSGGNYHSQLYNLNCIFQKFMYKVEPPSTSDRMLSNVKFFMSFRLNQLYNKYYSTNVIFCQKLIERAIVILIERLKKNKWLLKETIKKAITKIEHIQIFIGHKPKIDKPIEIEFTKNMFDNYIKLNRTILKDNIQKINEVVLQNTYYFGDMSSYEINANYSTNNSIFISNSILQPPFITNNFIHTLAFLGIIICHELIHALDDEGCKYDENGVYKNWWSSEDKKNYEKIKKNILNLYKHYSKNDDTVENLKMGENIADLSSIKIVEDILDHYLENNPDKEKYFREFYRYYAELYRTKNYKTYFEVVKNDPHSYGKYRINCILANSEKFRKYFGISENDKMYSKIIDIW